MQQIALSTAAVFSLDRLGIKFRHPFCILSAVYLSPYDAVQEKEVYFLRPLL